MKHDWDSTNMQRGHSATCRRCGIFKKIGFDYCTRYYKQMQNGFGQGDFTTKAPECVDLKASPKGESFSPTPRTGQ